MWSNDGYADQPGVDGYGTPVPPPAVVAPHVGYGGAAYQPSGTAVALAPPPATAPAPTAIPDGAFDVPPTLAERIELCRFLADANLLPQALRKQPANVLLIMHKALALNLPLSVALEHLHVIDGKVGHSAELLRGLLARAGHILRWIEISDKTATGELILRHDPRNPRRETFTIADAQRMKLVNKDNWQKDPASMLVARATTRLISRHCPEIAVALGNLSAIDVEEEPPAAEPVQATAEAGPSLETQAAQLYEDAKTAGGEVLRAIGVRAREAGLLDVKIGPNLTLQEALLQRIDQISKQRKASSGNDGAKPKNTATPEAE
jgi:hypothetical protein